MNSPDIKQAIESFVAFSESPNEPVDENISRLLDEVLRAYHYPKFTFDDSEYPDPPDLDYDKCRKVIEVSFPDYGHYNVAEDIAKVTGSSTLMVGDAIDDLTDLNTDFKNILWRWEHNSEADALIGKRKKR